MLRAFALLLFSTFVLSAQQRVPAEFMYHRVYAVAPMIGTGTAEDPIRPMFVPAPAVRPKVDPNNRGAATQAIGSAADIEKPAAPPPIISYSMQISDDGKSALVVFVGQNPAALKFITDSKAPGVKTFEQGKATKDEIEAEFTKQKKNFKAESLIVGGAR